MKAVRVQNLRCLKDTGYVDVKPLTIALGENSSGKSSFVRLFPLFKQSTEARPQGPILFFGDYVDFGSFAESIHCANGTREKTINLSFKLELSLLEIGRYSRRRNMNSQSHSDLVNIEFTVKLSATGDIPWIQKFECIVIDNSIKFEFSSDGDVLGLTVNSEDFREYAKKIHIVDSGRIFPRFVEEIEGRIDTIHRPISPRFRYSFENGSSLPAPMVSLFLKTARPYDHANTSTESILRLLTNNSIVSKEEGIIRLVSSSDTTKTWQQKTKNWKKSKRLNKSLETLSNLSALDSFFNLTAAIEDSLESTFRTTKYLEPLRATAQRYYRKQNLSVADVDSRGENLPMYISNLSLHKKRRLETWMQDNFDVKLTLKTEGGHVGLYIENKGSNEKHNMADMGFGFSQVMPILVQLWAIIDNPTVSIRRKKHPLIYVIEQPELHLHPKMQAQLASTFCKAVKTAEESSIELRIIIETHSEAIVNEIGNRIAEREFSEGDVGVFIFEKDVESASSKVRESAFDKQGQLTNWPWGFFNY